MDYEAWHKKRKELTDKELAERSQDLGRARPNLQTAVNEQAIRQLYEKLDVLEARLSAEGKAK